MWRQPCHELLRHAHQRIQPDQRVEQKVDADGHTVIETGAVPGGPERNVELPPTEAGGKPKDEAHQTPVEKARSKKYEETGDVDKAEAAATEVRSKAISGAARDTAVKSAPKNK